MNRWPTNTWRWPDRAATSRPLMFCERGATFFVRVFQPHFVFEAPLVGEVLVFRIVAALSRQDDTLSHEHEILVGPEPDDGLWDFV